MTLKEKFKDDFWVGAAVNTRTIQTHKELLTREFNSITCENEMKYGEVTSDGITYNFQRADKIAAFAHDNNMAMRMHTFLWHNQTPQAIFENATRQSLIHTLMKHIQKMADRYGDQIYACDVANEVIADSQDKILAGGIFRKSPWVDIIGEDFCDIAFHASKAALPNAALFYNDYNEWDEGKSKRIYALVKGMKERGVPVDGLGLQCHWNIKSPNFDQIKRALELYSRLDVKLHITEMDISLYVDPADPLMEKPFMQAVEKQASLYKQAFSLFKQYSGKVTSVTLWGVADDETWLDQFPVNGRKDWPLLFDESHEPKLAWQQIMDI